MDHTNLDSTVHIVASPSSNHSETVRLFEASIIDEEQEADDSSIDLRTASLIHVAFVAFFLVSGGPIGVEEIIKAAGPFFAFLGILIFPFIFAIPQAFVTAEMSTMCDSNGGYVVWCTRAFGAFGGWINGFNSMFCNIFDVAMYPVVFVDYLAGLFEIDTLTRWLIIIGVLLLVLFLNVNGVDIVGNASVFFFIVVFSPFVAEFFALLHNDDLDFSIIFKRQRHINWNLFVNIIFWNFNGWDNLGSIAGEVSNPRRTYPLAVLLALAFMTFLYMFAIFVGLCIDQDFGAWTAGHFVAMAQSYAPWLGYWMEVGATIASLGMLNATLSSNSRVVWRLGKYHMLPESAAFTYGERKCPLGGMLVHIFFCIALAPFSFNALLQVNNFLNGASLLMKEAAFIYLKISEPHTPRPFAIPGGLFGAIMIAFPVFGFVGFVLFLAPLHVWLVVAVLNIVFLLLYLMWKNGWLAVVSPFWVSPDYEEVKET